MAGLVLCLPLAARKFVPATEKQKQGSLNSAQAPDQGFDSKVAAKWDAKVVPYARAKAGSLADVKSAIAVNADAAGAKYGHKEKCETSPWTPYAEIEGKVTAANTKSLEAMLNVDASGDGKADAQVQIGPVIRGKAQRNSLDFVNVNDVTNQVDFAQFAKAFSTNANEKVLKQLPLENLAGKTGKVLDAFPMAQGQSLPQVTPVTIELLP